VNEHNPFAPSAATLAGGPAPGGTGHVGREGRHLVLVPGTPLPPRCVKCNAPAALPSRLRTVYWHHWGYYFIILLNILVYAVVALVGARIVVPREITAQRIRLAGCATPFLDSLPQWPGA
jgi:hypothetical protein